MDPGSVGVAVVGLTASLITITGLCLQTSKKLYVVLDKLKRGPEELRRLSVSVRLPHTLFESFRAHLNDQESQWLPEQVIPIWQGQIQQMDLDLAQLESLVSKLMGQLNNNANSRLRARSRVTTFFAGEGLKHWESILNAHIQHFTLYYSMITSARSDYAVALLSKAIPLLSSQGSHLSSSASTLFRPQNALRETADTRSPDNDTPKPWISVSDPLDTATAQSWTTIARKQTSPQSVRRVVQMQWSTWRFPLGILTVEKTGRTLLQDLDGEFEQEWAFSYAPPSWLTARMVRVAFFIKTSSTGSPGFRFCSSSTQWNTNRLVSQYVFMGNVNGLKRLFKEGKAQPCDVVAPSGRSLLHEAVLSFSARKPGAFDMIRFLLSQGADVNVRDMDGQTPLLLCCWLMFQWKTGPVGDYFAGLMLPLSRTLIAAGADPSLCGGEDSCSTFSSFFSNSAPLSHLFEIVTQHVDAANFDELSTFDNWILAILFRADKKFRRMLSAQIEELHTIPALSTYRHANTQVLERLSLESHAQQLLEADPAARVRFMWALCRRGTSEMVQPLLHSGISIHEADNTPMSYLAEATFYGNHEIMVTLLDAGADIEAGRFASAPQALFNRWREIYSEDSIKTTQARSSITRTIRSELYLMEELVKRPRLDSSSMPTILLQSLSLDDENACFNLLLDAGFGISTLSKKHEKRQIAQRPHSSLYAASTAWFELIETVYYNNLHAMQLLVDRGAVVEDEDDCGCTALIIAIDLGRTDLVQELVMAGEALLHTTSACGYSAWDLAVRNLNSSHPRLPIFNHQPTLTTGVEVSEQIDLAVYACLKRAKTARRRRGLEPEDYNKAPFRRVLRRMEYIQAEAIFKYSEMQKMMLKLSPWDVLLALFGFMITLLALVCYEAWDGVWWLWRKSRWVLRSKKLIIGCCIPCMLLLWKTNVPQIVVMHEKRSPVMAAD